MIIKVIGSIWDLKLSPNKLIVLLAYTDHADHDGKNIYPSVDKIAWKTGYSSRTVQRVTAELIEDGLLVEDGKGPFGTNRYKFDFEAGIKKTEFVPKRKRQASGDKVTPDVTKDDKMSPDIGDDKLTPDMNEQGGDILSGGGDKLSCPDSGDKSTPGGDAIMSPEPSFEPSFSEPSGSESSSSVLIPTTPLLEPHHDEPPLILLDKPVEDKEIEPRTESMMTMIYGNWSTMRTGGPKQGRAGDVERAAIRKDVLEFGAEVVLQAEADAKATGKEIWSWAFVHAFLPAKQEKKTPDAYVKGRYAAFINNTPPADGEEVAS